MPIQVLFFGATADAAGRRQLNLGTETVTLTTLVASVIREHPKLAQHKLQFAINQEHAAGDETIRDGDEVAIFTPVSGG
ncbi:MAG: MoaD/ThiS family protein [Pyrinomonadaceae bacterium]